MSAGSLNDHSCRSRRKSPAFSFAILTSKNLSGSSLPPPQFRDQFGGWEVAADPQEQLSAIAALQHKLAGLAGPERALDLIARESVRVTEACGSAIAVLLGDAVVCRARAGSVGPPLGTSLDTQAGLAGACFRTGQVVRCDDTQTDPRVDANACRQAGIRSVLAVPLRQQYGIAGVFVVFSSRPAAFGYVEIRLLQLLAGLAENIHITRLSSANAEFGSPAVSPVAAATENLKAAKDSESTSAVTPAISRPAAGRKQISKCLDRIRRDAALQVLARAKAYLTIEALYDGKDRSSAIALLEELMFQRAAEIGVPLSSKLS